ncbi:MAG: hypothetical protein ACFFCS_01050 [Candidatus Hodarchaeota archaeon]
MEEASADALEGKTLKDGKINYWHVIGIQRPIASFWYNYIFLLIAAIPALVFFSYLLPNFILPFPSAMGFNSLTVNYFGLFFSIMDMATAPAAERFISQYAEINPKRAIKYISFFIWFQMFTGLIQVTAVTFFALFYIVNTNLNYAMWFFLTYSLTQFPGMLGAFKSGLKGFQQFDKSNKVELVQGMIFESLTQFIFIFLGRWIGMTNPILGELYGATMGFIIGRYVDDFIAMAMAGKYLSRILKPYGIKLREAVVPTFGRDIAKECLVYGIKLVGSTVISAAAEYVTLVMMVAWLPQYVFIMGILELARGIAGLVSTKYNYAPLISESYNNGKKELAKYSITQFWNSWWFLGFFLALQITILVPPVFVKLGGNFAYTSVVLPIYVLPRLIITPTHMGTDVCQAVDKPEFRTWGIVTEKATKMVTVFLFLSPWGLRHVFGETSLIELYILHDIPAYMAIGILQFALVHKYCVKVKINIYQTFFAGTVASLPVVPLSFTLVNLFLWIWDNTTSIIYPLILVVSALFLLLFVFPVIIFFFYAFLGGLDSRSLEHYKNAVSLCGPSKPLVKFFIKGAELGFKVSPIKDKFRTPWEEADKEARELMELQAIGGK